MRTELDFWTAAETQSKLENGELYGLGPLEQLMARYVREHLSSVNDLSLLEQPTEIEPGVLVFPAPGHTPGHAAVLISSGRQQLLYMADAVLHPAQFENPEWMSAFDLSRDETLSTRKQLLDRAASDRCLVAGFHLPGGVGAVEARQGRFRWEPAASQMAAI
jgi:glyoxylase-like metal-dependent hydrolase (beta-lactamase superfamily II)